MKIKNMLPSHSSRCTQGENPTEKLEDKLQTSINKKNSQKQMRDKIMEGYVR